MAMVIALRDGTYAPAGGPSGPRNGGGMVIAESGLVGFIAWAALVVVIVAIAAVLALVMKAMGYGQP